MKKSISQMNRRIFVAINYFCLFGFQIFFVWGENSNWPVHLVVITITFLVLLVLSFIPAYIGSGVWIFSKTHDKNLDERQMQIRNHVLRNSYAIYGILTVIVIAYLKETSEPSSIFGAAPDGVPFAIYTGILYIVNILPASLLAWQEKEI
ncbi:hypothetical protein ACFLTH_00040 [Bacteroidota bacterium]